mgnify:CR=1 FL=1
MHRTNLQRFNEHVAIVTGAAGGIGNACALRFAQEGANVACLDVKMAGAEATAAECRKEGAGALAMMCNVTDEASVNAAITEVLQTWGRIDVLVAAAGIYTGGLIADVSLKQWQRLIDINLTGVFLCNKAVAPVLIKQQRGTILNISSMSGKTSWPGTLEYSASKSGVIGLTRSVAMELASHGATANAICPGNTKTELVLDAARQNAAADGITPEEWLQRRANDCPMKRMAEPWEIAALCAFLASDDARYITGQSIEIDGGMIMS